MRENIGDKFLNDLFAFLDSVIDSGAEVHIVDKSDPNHETEHVFNADKDDDVPFCDVNDNCANCDYADECGVDCPFDSDEFEPDMWGIPDIDRIVFSGPATIVFWSDGTKTVVKAMKGEKIEKYAGFAAACMKKMFGSTSRAKAIMNELAVDEDAKPKKVKVGNTDMSDAFNYVASNNATNDVIQEAINETFTKG